MIHKNSRFSRVKVVWSSVFSVAVVALCTSGCGAADATPDANATDTVGSTSEALTGAHAYIAYEDDRTATSFQVTFATTDQYTGKYSIGVANVPGPLTSGTTGVDYMTWYATPTTGTWLNQVGYTTNASYVQITDTTGSGYRFTTSRVTVRATINGACHLDYEDIDISSDVYLVFNGEGGTWNSTDGCWEGDLLYKG
jgi:hypothetical protein